MSRSGSDPRALALGGMIALAASVGVGRFVYTPILPVMAEALHLSKSQAGVIASANFLGYLAGALLASLPRLPGRRKTWLLGMLAVCAATTVAMGVDGPLGLFLAMRFIGGGASAFVLVLASALVLEGLAASGRPGLAAVHFAGVGVGIAVSAAVVTLLLASGAGWQALWQVSGGLMAAATAGVAWLVPARERGGASLGQRVARVRGLGALLTAYGLFGFGYVVTATFLVAIVRGSAALRSVEPVVWLVVGLAAAPSVAVWTWAARRLGIPRAFSLACVVEAAGVAASVLWPSIAGVLSAAVLLGGTFMGLTALGLAGGRRLAPLYPQPVLARLTASFGVGQIVGPALAGYLFDLTGGFAVPSLLAAAALLAASGVIFLTPLRSVAE